MFTNTGEHPESRHRQVKKQQKKAFQWVKKYRVERKSEARHTGSPRLLLQGELWVPGTAAHLCC